MRRVLVAMSIAPFALLASVSAAWANTTTFISTTFSEPAQVNFRSGCAVFPEGFCGTGEVRPFGQATETIEFGAGCGGSCDLRTIRLAEGTIFLQETSSGGCDASCHTYPVEQVSASLTDTVIGGTGLFEGATGRLTGTVHGAVSNARPAGASSVRVSGTIHYDP
jgi:hypothetical protein